MKASSLRPVIVRVMWEHRGSALSTGEIYDLVAATGVTGIDARAKRDRNLVNRELSDLAGMSSNSHAKPAPHLLTRVGRGRYVFRVPDMPADRAQLREYLELKEVYEKRPQRRRSGLANEEGPESVRKALFAVQRGICPGCGFSLPHFLRCDLDYVVALFDDGRAVDSHPKLLCDSCSGAKDANRNPGLRLGMAELQVFNVAAGVMVDEDLAALTEKRLARYHRENLGGHQVVARPSTVLDVTSEFDSSESQSIE